MMRKRMLSYFLPVIVILFALAGCSSEPTALEVDLHAEDIKWDISEITANVDQTVEITITNDGALDHNFVIEELGIAVELSPGESEVITFVVTEAGELEFICSIPGHQDAGMAGTLTINP